MSSDFTLSRRSFVASALAAAAFPGAAFAAGAARFATVDYGLAQTLIAIGADLVAITQRQNWATWTVEPPMPDGVANLGTSREPNLELLQRLGPDHILSTPYLESIRPLLERIAPVESFPIHALGHSPYENIVAATRRLGDLADRRDAAEVLIADAEHLFEETRPKLANLRTLPLIFLHFVDSRHVRIYGPNCIIQDALDRLELRNAWPGPTNSWGFATAGIERLVEVGDAWVMVFDPVPPDTAATLPGSPLWQSLPFVKAGRVRSFPNVLAFGTLPAATRMARLLTELEL